MTTSTIALTSVTTTYYAKAQGWSLSDTVDYTTDDTTIHTWVDVDTEFQAQMNRPARPITAQLKTPHGSVQVFEHPELGLTLEPTWTGETALSAILGLTARYVPEKPRKATKRLVAHVGMFFSPADLLQLFHNPKVRQTVAENLKQQRRVSSVLEHGQPIYTGLYLTDPQTGFDRALMLQPQDASALLGNASLKALASALGVPMDDKDLLTREDKGQMLQTYQKRHSDFLDYATGDVIIRPLFEKYQELCDRICDDLGIERIRAKHTLGANVAKVSELLISQNLDATPADVSVIPKAIFGKDLKTTADLVLALAKEGTASWLAGQTGNTKYLLAMVDGGRCKNESPVVTRLRQLLVDIDISGCYGNGLMNQVYPVGRPCFKSFDKTRATEGRDDRPTLSAFLKSKLSKELVSGLWYARVSTTERLTFSQDLLISKEPPAKFKDPSSGYDASGVDLTPGESNEVLGNFILLTRELRSATLTSDLLQVLKETMTSREWSEFCQKTVVDALMYYPKLLQVDSLEALTEKIASEDKGIYTKVNKTFGEDTSDRRSHHWVAVPMGEGWIDKLLGLRKNYPKNNPETKPMNEGYKVFINATYGILASIHFPVGNVCVANNITARARALAWMMAKALGSYQSITDGGAFGINAVNSWSGSKPGMNTLVYLSEVERLTRQTVDKNGLTTTPLGGDVWTYQGLEEGKTVLLRGSDRVVGCKENWSGIDQLAWGHLKTFFPGDIDILQKPGIKVLAYNKDARQVVKEPMEGLFSFETKDVYLGGAFQSQANYILIKPDGKTVLKARGYETNKDLYRDPYGVNPYVGAKPPIELCLEAILEGKDIPAFPQTYNPTVLKVAAWKEQTWLTKENNLMPGDTTSRASWVRPISISMFRWQTWEQFQSWEKRHNRLKEQRGYGLELFFMTDDGSVRYQEAVRVIQDAIEAGQNWIVGSKTNDPEGCHPYVAGSEVFKKVTEVMAD